METVQSAEPPAISESRVSIKRPKTSPPAPPILFACFFGVLWPAISLGVELATGTTSQIWIDPVPTIWHILLIAWVPISNLILAFLLQSKRAIPRTFFLLHGLATGISIFYWIELFPFTIAGIIFCWTVIGLLPLGPVASLFATLRLRKYCRENQIVSTPRRHGSLAALSAMCLLLLLEIPTLVSAFGLTLATNGAPSQRAAGEKILRYAAPESEVVRFAANERPMRFNYYLDFVQNITGLLAPAPDDAAREIYRATGQNPAHLHKTRFAWDSARAGARVGSLLPNVALADSKAEIIANANDGYSYSEWTMTFSNSDPIQQEARCEVLLPPGGVVSRLTLWVNGEEREAAFAGNAQVREAYTKVVATRRDPVLVTAAGPGRILVQCFPVPPSGTMKIRFGITAPLLPETEGRARYTFPILTDKNFVIDIPTTARIHGGEMLTQIPGSHQNSDPKDPYTESNFTLHDAAAPSFEVAAPVSDTKRWHRDTRDLKNQYVIQSVHKIQPAPAKPIFVIDGSAALQDQSDFIWNALSRIPNAPILLATGHRPQKIQPNNLRDSLFTGGADNVIALEAALDLAAQQNLDTIIWIHGPQPVLLTPITHLNNVWRHQPNVRLISVPLVPGENDLLRQLGYTTQLDTIPNLVNALDKISARQPVWIADYETHDTLPTGLTSQESSSHLPRLWAARQIQSLLAADNQLEALQLAPRYQLVTAISGAVVLETQKQFDEAGLKSIDPKSAPAVPEPTTWALLILGTVTLFLKRRFKQQIS